jgi:hypothetical protein
MERKQGCFTLMKRGAAAEDKAEQIKWSDAIAQLSSSEGLEASKSAVAGLTWSGCVATTHG